MFYAQSYINNLTHAAYYFQTLVDKHLDQLTNDQKQTVKKAIRCIHLSYPLIWTEDQFDKMTQRLTNCKKYPFPSMEEIRRRQICDEKNLFLEHSPPVL